MSTTTQLKDTLENYTLDFLDMSLYDVAQLSHEEIKDKLKTYYEFNLADLTSEERESRIEKDTSQIFDQLDALSEYISDLSEKIEESKNYSQVAVDQRLLNELQSFFENEGKNLSLLNTTLIMPELARLSELIVETEEDVFFTYDQSEHDRIYAGEVVVYHLKKEAVPLDDSLNTTTTADTNQDAITDLDVNGDSMKDAKDLTENMMPYDFSGQDFYLELNPHDEIVSVVYDASKNKVSFEIATQDKTLDTESGSQDIQSKTFLLEVNFEDLNATNFFIKSAEAIDFHAFKELDPQILKHIYDGDSAIPLLSTLNPEYSTPEFTTQMESIPGYKKGTEQIQNVLSILNEGFENSDNAYTLPAQAEDIVRKMYDSIFDAQGTNSYSKFSHDEAINNFYKVIEGYSQTEQASLVMAFALSFIKGDAESFKTIMGNDILKLQDTINGYKKEDADNLSLIEKVTHTIIENTLGYGQYTLDGSYGTIATSGLAFASSKGVSGQWSAHKENVDVIDFIAKHGFDSEGLLNETRALELGLSEGEISQDMALTIQSELDFWMNETTYRKGAVDLNMKQWQSGLLYLRNHLFNQKGELVDHPQLVFQKCIDLLFKNKDGTYTVGADAFACSLFMMCEFNSVSGFQTAIMQGPEGDDIIKYLWGVANNGGTKPVMYSWAEAYKNRMLK